MVSEPSLLFSGTVGGTAPDPVTLEITNGGGGSVGGISASLQYPEGGATGWLSLALAGTSAPTTLTVTGLLGLLREGTHEATLVLASEDDRTSPGTTAPAELMVQPDPSGLSPGIHTAEVRVTGPGALNTPLSAEVTFTIDVGAVSPARSTATLPDGTAGSATDIVVQATAASGYPLTSGGAKVVMTVSGANAAGPMTATDMGDGTYTATYTPRDRGTDSVAITMNGTPIKGSPFTSKVSR